MTNRYSRGRIVLDFARPSVRLRPMDTAISPLLLRPRRQWSIARRPNGRTDGPHKTRSCRDGCNARSKSSVEDEGEEPQMGTALIRLGFVIFDGKVAWRDATAL